MHRRYAPPLIACVLVLLAYPHSHAETWRVEKDGSGDFTVIQDAVDTAAVGDTIRIGPGRFSEFTSVTTPGWTEDVFVNVTVDSLTFIGAGSNMTIIGPGPETTADTRLEEPLPRPSGVLGWTNTHGAFRDIGFDSTYWLHTHITWDGASIDLRNCRFTSSGTGLALWGHGHSVIARCEFLDMNSIGGTHDYGIQIWDSGSGVDILDCTFENCTKGVIVSNSANVNIDNCVILTGIYTSIHYFFDSDDCRVTNTRLSSAVVTQSSSVDMDTCTFVAPSALSVTNHSIFRGNNLILPGNENYTIEASNSSVTINHSHILRNGGAYVFLYLYPDEPSVHLDFTHNYWGTSSPDTIAAWIHDGHDDPEIKAFVDFEPFEVGPVPSETRSFGDVKRMFR